MLDALLVTKFFIPTPEYTFVPRPQLMQRFNAILTHRLTVITAPPGSGKSATTAAWLDLHPETIRGWVSLDSGDNDPARFVAYLVGTLRHHNPTVQRFQSLSGVDLPPQTILTSLLNAISQLDSQMILAIDDVHVINNPAVQGLMGFFIDHAPPQLHIIMLSRRTLSLPLGRLRVQHQLAEFDGHDLNFDSSEIERYFRGITAHPLSTNELLTLKKRTEGWIAGLQLAGLALQNTTDSRQLMAGFTGDHAYIVDYLTDEVLNHLTPEIHEFLLHTAVLERLCADLCSAVTGHSDGQTQLEALYRANLFVIPLDSQRIWFRYHHLFGELLRTRLHRRHPELVPQLHRRASEWFTKAGYGREAIAHVFEAGDYTRAAELIEREGQTIFGRGEIGTAMGWISRLPDTVRRARPALMIGMAWPLTINGEILEAARYIDEALETLSEQSPENHLALLGEADAIRSIHLVMRHHLSDAAVLGTQALQRLPSDAYMQRAIVTMNLGMAAMFGGDIERAGRILMDAVELSRLAHNISTAAMSRHHLASIQWAHGDLAQTEIIARQMLSLAETWNQNAHPVMASAYEWLCRVHYERNALDAAAEAIQHGIRLAEPVEIAFFLRSAWLQLACIRRAQSGHRRGSGCDAQSRNALSQIPTHRGHGFHRTANPLLSERWRSGTGTPLAAIDDPDR